VLAKTKSEVYEILKKSIRPEFLNRIDEVIMFEPLTRENVSEIVKIQFEDIKQRLFAQNINITITPEAVEWLAQLGYDPQFGARPVKRVIQKQILNELSKQILAGKVNKDKEITIDMFDNKFVFRN
jgi:ATP-dependent Clp protease ATP-binding subunit ClpB